MELLTQTISDAVGKVLAGTGKGGVLDRADHIFFTGTHLSTYNDMIAVSVPFNTEFVCSVSAMDLQKVLKSLPEDNCQIVLHDEALRITTTSTEIDLPYGKSDGPVIDILNTMYEKELVFVQTPSDFLHGVNLCLFSVSKYASARVLSCLSVDGNLINSTDDLRISEYQMAGEFAGAPFLLPGKSAQELSDFGSITEYCHDGAWMHFKNETGAIFSCQLVLDEYPNPDEYFQVDGESIVLPVTLADAVSAVGVMADDSVKNFLFINVSIEPGLITVSGQRTRGRMKRKVDYPGYNGPAISFDTSPQFLTDILKLTTIMKVGEGRVLFEAGMFRHIVAVKG